MLRHERQHHLRFAALESGVGRAIRARYPDIASDDSMIWVDRPGTQAEQVHIRSAAVLRIVNYMGGIWRLALAGAVVPRTIRDGMYDVIARHRHALVAEPAACYVPGPEVRARFIG